MKNSFFRIIWFVVASTSSLQLFAQPPYLENDVITVPVVTVGKRILRVELTMDTSTDPVSVDLTDYEDAENPILTGNSFFKGSTLTIPKMRVDGKNYEYKMKLVSLSPIRFEITSIKEISENFPLTNFTTYSPESCQADIELFGEESFTVQDHPPGYKGNMYGTQQVDVETSNFPQSALVVLNTGTILAVTGQHPPGFPDGATFRLPVKEFTVAPDFGDQNDHDYPLAFTALVRQDSFNSFTALYRSDGAGGLSFVLSTGDNLQLSSAGGVVDEIVDIRQGPGDTLYFTVLFEDDSREFLVKQDSAGSGLSLVLGQGDLLNAGFDDETLRIGQINNINPESWYQVIADVEVVDENGLAEGFASLTAGFGFDGFFGCNATDTILICGGLFIPEDKSLTSFSTDGGTTAGVISVSGGQEFEFKVIGLPTNETILTNTEYQGFTFNSFSRPRICSDKNAVYFVGRFFEPPVGAYDELMRIDENGNLTRLTDFQSLLLDTSLEGEVPDEIRNWAIGYNCDAAMYTHGPSGPDSSNGYEGYWASYVTGETLEILDETSGRSNGNGSITDVSGSTSGIDFSTGEDTVVNTGPEGEFYFVPRIRNENNNYVSTYAIARKPTSCL